MTEFLQSVEVTNFRSISGSIDVRLDAPVVLIHGPNAVGKTSIMSAIELALTGRLDAFSILNRRYADYLTYRGSESARVVLNALEGGESRKSEFAIAGDRVKGEALLDSSVQAFFSERCYLGQATLTRLLELYQQPGRDQRSALTRFVKDLLGVEVLDALTDGLFLVGHIQRIRNAIPAVEAAEYRRTSIEKDIRLGRDRLSALESEISSVTERLSDSINQLGEGLALRDALDPDRAKSVSNSKAEEDELTQLAVTRPEVDAVRREAASGTTVDARLHAREAKRKSDDAVAAFEEWNVTAGDKLRKLIVRLESVFPALPNPDVVDAEYALQAARSVVEQELARCKQIVSQAEKAVREREAGHENVTRASHRLAIIERDLSAYNDEAEGLADALNRLIKFIRSDKCPVCERDYSEISPDEPLVNHVSRRVGQLLNDAARMRELINEQGAARRAIQTLRTAIDERSRLIPKDQELNATKQRAAQLADDLRSLDELRQAAKVGTSLRERMRECMRALLLAEKNVRSARNLPRRIDEIASRIGANTARSATDLEKLAIIQSQIKASEDALRRRVALKERFAADVRGLRALEAQINSINEELNGSAEVLKRLNSQLRDFEARRTNLRSLSKAASEARGAVIRTAFTKSLNKLWRDLFIRLAPDEGYVPAFKIPEPSGHAGGEVELVTVHREGGSGGPPGSMLSAGNLNTAALTLFLALHLSVEARLPLLMLDDPVQSMDEVHTVQLAALLRVMSKERQARQIIIAVHERSLFEYLSFELAPSFPGDRLITIELSRSASGGTIADNQYHTYREETAVA